MAASDDGGLAAARERLQDDEEDRRRLHADSLLLASAVSNDVGEARRAREMGARLAVVDGEWGLNPLMIAAKHGFAEMVDYLLGEVLADESGPAVDTRSLPLAPPDHSGKQGLTALWLAAAQNHTRVVQSLLFARASVDLATESGDTPLRVAASSGHTDVVRVLCNASADPSIAVAGETPLEWARGGGYSDVMATLERIQSSSESTAEHAERSTFVGVSEEELLVVFADVELDQYETAAAEAADDAALRSIERSVEYSRREEEALIQEALIHVGVDDGAQHIGGDAQLQQGGPSLHSDLSESRKADKDRERQEAFSIRQTDGEGDPSACESPEEEGVRQAERAHLHILDGDEDKGILEAELIGVFPPSTDE